MSRKRYVYRKDETSGELVAIEVNPDYERYAERTPVSTDLYMDGTRSTDGVDIGSRAKRRQYMAARGLADADDFRGVWAKAEKERASNRDNSRATDIAMAIESIQRKKR